MVNRQSDAARSRIGHACPDCGRPWAIKGVRAGSASLVFWCRFCQWQDTRHLENASAAPAAREPQPPAPAPAWIHGAHLYTGDAELVSAVAAHLRAAWAAGGIGVVVATAAHRSALHELLAADGLADSVGSGRLIELDAHDTAALFMRDGMPDRELFHETVGAMVRGLGSEGPLHLFGEVVGLVWGQGNRAGALELERLWGELQRTMAISLLCGYAEEHVGDGDLTALADVHDHLCAA